MSKIEPSADLDAFLSVDAEYYGCPGMDVYYCTDFVEYLDEELQIYDEDDVDRVLVVVAMRPVAMKPFYRETVVDRAVGAAADTMIAMLDSRYGYDEDDPWEPSKEDEQRLRAAVSAVIDNYPVRLLEEVAKIHLPYSEAKRIVDGDDEPLDATQQRLDRTPETS